MATPRATFVCASCSRALRHQTSPQAIRAFSSSAAQSQAPSPDLPRWQQTPPRMKMPFRLRPRPNQSVWKVNDQQAPLDEMYDHFIGRAGEAAKGQPGLEGTRGRDMLPEEVKWLAITHKSFDHGRQGFNDKLAFLGKRLIDLQTSLALLRSPTTIRSGSKHPALTGLENLTPFAKHQILSPERLSNLARTYGVDRVVRWQPKKSDNLQGSGVHTVLAHTVYSIIGAVALQRGGEVAGRVARERVLGPLGLR